MDTMVDNNNLPSSPRAPYDEATTSSLQLKRLAPPLGPPAVQRQPPPPQQQTKTLFKDDINDNNAHKENVVVSITSNSKLSEHHHESLGLKGINGGGDKENVLVSITSNSKLSEHHHESLGLKGENGGGEKGGGEDVETKAQNGGGNCERQWDLLDAEAQGHWHYSHRSPWLRALVLGANDGLISISSLMMGVGAVKNDARTMVISGLAGLVAGAGSMAIGEYVSVFSQRDTEMADIEKERQEHAKGPEAQAQELEELTQIYVGRGLPYYLAKQVAEELSKVDVLKAHVRDELGIDVDALSNPLQAASASAMAFSLGGGVPLLGGAFIASYKIRIAVVVAVSSIALAAFGAVGARLGGAPISKAALRVLLGGWLAMALTYGILRILSTTGL